MGRDLRPARVYQATKALISAHRLERKPNWYDAVGEVTTAQTLVRTQPIPHQQRRIPKGTKKASRLFQPRKITYEEDTLRREFFKDHPWELARPRTVLENTGADSYSSDWSQLEQPHIAVNSESVIQRQLWLLQNHPSMTRAEAYDKARKEFYDLRLQQDVERRVAREEALATGAQFGKSVNEIGMEIEDVEYERWKEWAKKEAEKMVLKRSTTYTDYTVEDSVPEVEPEELETVPEEPEATTS